jgi:RimJ/RimL family protein N-acetyltransferase
MTIKSGINIIPMISLQPFDKTDFDQLIGWIKDEEALMQFAGASFSFPLTHAQLESSLADTNRLGYSILCTADKTIIGHAEIYFPDNATAHLCRILIGDMKFREKGLGLETVNHLLNISFSQPGIEEASLNVFDWNKAAIKCYTKAGFTVNSSNTITRRVKDQLWTVLNMRLAKKNKANLQ